MVLSIEEKKERKRLSNEKYRMKQLKDKEKENNKDKEIDKVIEQETINKIEIINDEKLDIKDEIQPKAETKINNVENDEVENIEIDEDVLEKMINDRVNEKINFFLKQEKKKQPINAQQQIKMPNLSIPPKLKEVCGEIILSTIKMIVPPLVLMGSTKLFMRAPSISSISSTNSSQSLSHQNQTNPLLNFSM